MSANEISRERRAMLTAKYPAITAARPMDPQLNTTVNAIVAAQRITSGTHPDNTPLFDPTWSPDMWERANTAVAELWWRMGLPDEDDPDRIRYTSDDYDLLDEKFDIENPPDDAVFIWSVGSSTVRVCCRAGAGLTDRPFADKTHRFYRQPVVPQHF